MPGTTIFLSGGKDCVCKHPSYTTSPSYFAALLQMPYYYSSEEFSCATVSYIALKQVTHGMVCLSESHQGLNFHDIICAQRYCYKLFMTLIFVQVTHTSNCFNDILIQLMESFAVHLFFRVKDGRQSTG